MPGRIRDEDIELVRTRSPIEQVVGEYLQLRNAGGGSLKGLCPFHDEKTPSFNVTPARGLWYCFSCAEGGDVIRFLERIDSLSFAEAVEHLAARLGIELRYAQGGQVPGQEQSQRRRLIAAHRVAADFYAENLLGADASPAREFLTSRGFDIADTQRFAVGYAPAGWDAAVKHLRGRGFTEAELLAGGLAGQGRRGLVDKFRGRLIWPIRDLAGDVIAFGARKLAADDTGPKYLNTPETAIFRKSSVLYGADLARRDIAQRRQAVIVEGYTDVMACHLSGISTAVATSGTSFGEGHITILRRLLMDESQFRGEVIFTFDGDAAGRRAALRAFGMEERFVTQTFVAIQPDGLDPCDLRLQQGAAAVRDLVASRVPLYEFAVRSVLSTYDMESAEGRVAALNAAAPIVARIKDVALRKVYAGNLDRWLGLMDQELVIGRINEHIAQGPRGGQGSRSWQSSRGGPGPGGAAARGSSAHSGSAHGGSAHGGPARNRAGHGGAAQAASDGAGTGRARAVPAGQAGVPRQADGGHNGSVQSQQGPAAGYDARDPVINLERQALKLAIQRPALCGPVFDALDAGVFSSPVHQRVKELIAGCGGVASAGPVREWAERLLAAAPNDNARAFVTRLAVEPVEAPGPDGEPDARYADGVLAQVEELAVSRNIAVVKSRLQRMSPIAEQREYNKLFGDLVSLEQRRKQLLDRVAGVA